RREGIDDKLRSLRPPRLQGRLRLDWPDLTRLVQALSSILKNRQDRMERRLRKCLALADLCRQARLDHIKGQRLGQPIKRLIASLENAVPVDPAPLPRPNWVGRVVFRQNVALFTRKDHGPDSGLARGRRLALLAAALRFARGSGPVPRMHKKIPETTFEAIEAATSPHDDAVEEILERYYTVKVESLQFCGAANRGLSVWDGFEVLALTYPLLIWVTRSMHGFQAVEAVTRALTIVDDHFGFNPVLGTLRQRISFRMLSGTGQLPRLIGWYAK